MAKIKAPSPVERIKEASEGLRGTIQESLKDELSGSVTEADQSVIKFHGIYQQDDRDVRDERAESMLDRLYTFMIRLRLPGGALSAGQWLSLDDICGEHTTGVIKITSRQTLQLHGLRRSHLKPVISSFNLAGLDSIATCGDINRNVTCTSHAPISTAHAEACSYADIISELLKPKTRAYYEIWLDGEKVLDKSQEEDALYGRHYLPRKFKIGIAIPPENDTDVFTNDIGLIAVILEGKFLGFNVAVGGGLSTTHGNAQTYPRLGTVLGFCAGKENILNTIYQIVTIQRDFGDRTDRKHARLKYTLDTLGVQFFKEELARRTGSQLEEAKTTSFVRRSDEFGWKIDYLGKWHYTLFIENGRVGDFETLKIRSALREIAKSGAAEFKFTCNQNLVLSGISGANKEIIAEMLSAFSLSDQTQEASPLRKNSMACVALSTCPLALAEGQRYMPSLITKIEQLLLRHEIKEEIVMRLTGCPNGCARPYVAEIGLVGTALGQYNLYLGGDREGLRLNKLYLESLDEVAILSNLDELFGKYRLDKQGSKTFGDFTARLS